MRQIDEGQLRFERRFGTGLSIMEDLCRFKQRVDAGRIALQGELQPGVEQMMHGHVEVVFEFRLLVRLGDALFGELDDLKIPLATNRPLLIKLLLERRLLLGSRSFVVVIIVAELVLRAGQRQRANVLDLQQQPFGRTFLRFLGHRRRGGVRRLGVRGLSDRRL